MVVREPGSERLANPRRPSRRLTQTFAAAGLKQLRFSMTGTRLPPLPVEQRQCHRGRDHTVRHCSTFECCIAHVAAPMAAKPTKGFAPSDFPFPVELWAKTLNDGTSAGGPSQRPVLLVLPDPIL